MRGRGIRDRLRLAALLGICLGAMALGASPALGYYSTGGSGSGQKVVSSLTVPTISTAAAAPGGTVALTWAKGSVPEGVAYYVTRDGGAPGGNCPTQAEPAIDVSTCTDSGLEPGTYTYKVFANFRTWSATSAGKEAKVTIGPADHFLLAAASTTPSAGAADNLTITAKDKAGSTVTTYAGSKNLTFEGAQAIGTNKPTVANSSGTAVAFGTATTLSFTLGVAAVNSTKNGLMRLYKAGPATISVTDGSIESEVDPTVTVAPLAMSKLVLSAATVTPVAGAEDALTTTAQDTYGNTATSLCRLPQPRLLRAGGGARGHCPDGQRQRRQRRRLRHRDADHLHRRGGHGERRSERADGPLQGRGGNRQGDRRVDLERHGDDHRQRRGGGLAEGRRRLDHPRRRGHGQPDDHGARRLRQHRDHLRRLPQPHLQRAGSEPQRHRGVGDQLGGHGDQHRLGDRAHLHQRGRHRRLLQERRPQGGAGRRRDAERHRRDDLDDQRRRAHRQRRRRRPYAWSAPTISAGVLGSPCLFTCTITALGNEGTFTAKVAVTDSLGNVVSNLGTANTVAVTAAGTTGSTVTGSPLTIATTGLAESTTTVHLHGSRRRRLHQHDHGGQVLRHRLHQRDRDGEQMTGEARRR